MRRRLDDWFDRNYDLVILWLDTVAVLGVLAVAAYWLATA